MSQASRARICERAYGPFPEEPQELDPELARLLAWFIQNRVEIATELGVKRVTVTDSGKGIVLTC